MKKITAMILLLAMVLALAACSGGTNADDKNTDSSEDTYTIGVLYLDQEVLLSEATAGCQAYAAEHSNVKLIEYNANKDVSTQLKQCENLISQNVDAIALTPVDGAGCDQIINACKDAGIPLICFHAKVNGAPITNILFDNVGFGKMQVDYAMEIFEKNGGDMNGTINVGIVTGKLDNQNAVERCQGYEEQLKNYANATIVDEQVGSWNRDDAMAIGISLAYANANVERPIIIGVGGTEEGLTAILNGDFDGTVFQPAYQNGYDAIDFTVKYLNGETLEESYVTEGVLVTPETAQATLDDLNAMLNS